MTDKATLRQQLKRQRQQLPKQAIEEASDKICAELLHYCQSKHATQVGLYWGCRGEVVLHSFLQQAQLAGIACSLPRVDGQLLTFHAYQRNDPLAENRFGIQEPLSTAPTCPLSTLDVLVMPLLAVTKTGDRLGMGAGYYDRVLGELLHQGVNLPALVGVAYDFQLVSAFATEAHDVAVDHIITPTQSFAC